MAALADDDAFHAQFERRFACRVTLRDRSQNSFRLRVLACGDIGAGVFMGASVISTSDILIHDREQLGRDELVPLPLDEDASLGDAGAINFAGGPTFVSEIMTPIVFTVRAEDPAIRGNADQRFAARHV